MESPVTRSRWPWSLVLLVRLVCSGSIINFMPLPMWSNILFYCSIITLFHMFHNTYGVSQQWKRLAAILTWSQNYRCVKVIRWSGPDVVFFCRVFVWEQKPQFRNTHKKNSKRQTCVFLQGGSAVPHESPDFGSLNPFCWCSSPFFAGSLQLKLQSIPEIMNKYEMFTACCVNVHPLMMSFHPTC